jgi:hypothetical protein
MVRSFSDRSIRRAISTVAAMVLIATPVQGQETPSDREAVLAVVQTLFDGMRARDADVVGGVFHEGAQMFRAPQVGGDGTVRSGSTEGFVNAVGGGTEVWDEPVWDPVVQVRDNLATVWIKYAFHCGVDAFMMARTGDGWKIIALADTFQQEDCELPPER